jgi:hypothetical protein
MAKEPKIAAANGHAGGGDPQALTGAAIQQAMDAAAADAFKRGIHDPAKVLELKLKAREKVKREHTAAVAKAARAARAKK